ncbi:hypothetical protein H5410_005109 [Solanum commersonii]|uniref:Uncharacterized protein n=1 Tax=Solanum commersonii TaxID=4109 RepID=A0A9J6A6H7_SOLCO|nr:hypothetical protein H5410_005109 [Solanum commersonii]
MSAGIQDITDNYGSHADSHWDPKALPEIKGINYRDVVAENASMASQLDGIFGDPFTRICMSNVTIGLAEKCKKNPWACTNIEGISSSVQPSPFHRFPPNELLDIFFSKRWLLKVKTERPRTNRLLIDIQQSDNNEQEKGLHSHGVPESISIATAHRFSNSSKFEVRQIVSPVSMTKEKKD